MPELPEVSAYLTEVFHIKIMTRMGKNGVNMKEGKLVGFKSFVTANNCNTGQIVFLNQNIPRAVSYYLKLYGAKLRCEFRGTNTHAHSTLFTKTDFSKLSDEDKKKIQKEFEDEEKVLVHVVGVVALSNPDEVILGLKVNIDGVNEWRAKYKLSPITNPHISCCHLRKEVFDNLLEGIVYQETGKWDKYLVFVKGGGCREIKNGNHSRYLVEDEKKKKKDEKKEERKDGKSLVWVTGIGLVEGEKVKENKSRVEKKGENERKKEEG